MQRLKSKTYNSRITSRGKVPESIRVSLPLTLEKGGQVPGRSCAARHLPLPYCGVRYVDSLIHRLALFQMLHSYIQGPVI